MASTFPAAIANEPPPLDASSEDEDSEEFRSHGLKLDVPSGEPTPVSTPLKRPLNKLPDKIKTAERNNGVASSMSLEECNHSSEEVYADSSDRVEHVNLNGVEDNLSVAPEDKNYNTPFHDDETVKQSETHVDQVPNNCDSSNNVNYNNSNSPQSLQLYVDTETVTAEDEAAEPAVCGDDEYPCETSKSTDQESSVGDFHTFGKENCSPTSTSDDIAEEKSEEFQECQVFELETSVEKEENLDNGSINPPVDDSSSSAFVQTKLTSTTLVEDTKLDDDDDDFEDDDGFGAFQSIPHPPPQQEILVVENNEKEVEEDDFGDFAHTSVHTSPDKTIPPPVTLSGAQTSQEEFEDFADFQDCSFQSCDGPGLLAKSPSVSSDLTLITSKIDSIIKSLFVIDSSLEDVQVKKPTSIDSEIIASSDGTWARIQDFEGSHGLMFKWLNSLTGKRLLRSLNISTSNIMYHEKWGTIEVPKFAASLVQSPLQPQSCNKLESQAKSEDHPAIVNNNTIISDDHDKPPSISTEAQEILRQLPDLSYMRANTLVFPQSSPSGL